MTLLILNHIRHLILRVTQDLSVVAGCRVFQNVRVQSSILDLKDADPAANLRRILPASGLHPAQVQRKPALRNQPIVCLL